MKSSVQAVLSGIAICVSIAAIFYSASVAKQISSSDHRAVEQVKSSTARLYSSLMSISEKWALKRTTKLEYDISLEQEVISDFVNSESALAYRAWIGNNKEGQR